MKHKQLVHTVDLKSNSKLLSCWIDSASVQNFLDFQILET